MNKKRWLALGIFIVLIVVYMTSSIGSIEEETQATSALTKYINGNNSGWATTVYQEGSGQKLALLKIEGIIMENDSNSSTLSTTYNHRVFLKQIEAAFTDPDIKGIILQLNSPGGGVYESDEVYHQIMQLKTQYKKPLVVYMSQQAASGAYYIAMAADKIYANRNTMTGSIGVIISTYNYTELAKKIGVTDVTFKSAANKDLLNPMRPITVDEQTIMQNMVDESYNYFVDIVTKGRDLEREKVLQLADGRIYSGAQAKNAGLVDELGYLEDAIDDTAKLAKTSDPQVLLYENPGPDLWNWFMSLRAPVIDLQGLSEQLQQQSAPQILYLSH
ncbi:MAG TPA: signal peptide peptidase SppA [Syntrophomonas sp.]|nr:signal peptide peptidase SppA [Syntrophomonas sp.]HPT70339.1 signal peptide peptidase SppA [Syntrophomonas sp.]